MSGVADERAVVRLTAREPSGAWFLTRIAFGCALFSLHVITSFTVSILHCDQGMLQGSSLNVADARLVLIAVTVAGLVGASWIALSSAATMRALRRTDAGGNGRSSFLAAVAAIVGGVLVVYLLWAFIVATTLPLC